MLTHYLDLVVNYIGDHPSAALVIVFLISAGEALFVIGLFVPSTVVLVGAGTLIGLGKLQFVPIFLASSLGAVAGDAISYWIGHTYKERIRTFWPFSRYEFLLDRGEAFFHRHGGKSVFIGRFIPGVKSVVPGVAGIVGMSVTRFSFINFVSAFAWVASHLLPGMGLGRAVGVTAHGNPRLLELTLVLLILGAIAWYTTKITVLWTLPRLDRVRSLLALRLVESELPASIAIRNLLLNERGVLVPFLIAMAGSAALIGFLAVVGQLLFDPEFVRSDASVSGYIQSLRTPVFDHVMVAVTMLGDSVVLAPVAFAVVVAMLWHRYWRLAAATTVAFVGSALFVPLIKTLIHRARPIDLYQGAEAFSFPSGHATLSVTIIGITLLICAHEAGTRTRLATFLTGGLLIALVGFSRLYLQAHWPSDVAAGLMFGASLVLMLAWLLHGRSLAPLSWRTTAVAGIVLLVAYPLHLYRDFSVANARYAPRQITRVVSPTEWIAEKGRSAPGHRILLNGELGEPMLIQTDISLEKVSDRLAKYGWQRSTDSQLTSLVNAILPSRASAAQFVPMPMTHEGKAPVAVFSKAGGKGSRIVLRFWRTDLRIKNQTSENPLLVASLSYQNWDSFVLGFALPENSQSEAMKAEVVAQEVADAISAPSTDQVLHLGQIFIVPWIKDVATPE